MSIQRFRHHGSHGVPDCISEHVSGEWVRYKNHIAAVEFAEEAEGRSWQQTVEELLTHAEQAGAALDQMTVDHLAELLTLGTKARAAGLQEAREAVAAAPAYYCEDQWSGADTHRLLSEALAAIDNLKEDK